jgi:multiple sugar transport system substrate-binding protein
LRQKIESGEYAPGEYIPAENELAQSFQLSRPSVRKALSELSEEGLIRTFRGKGSVVLETDQSLTVLNLFWGMPAFEYEAVSRLVEQFNKTNKKIRVDLIQVPRNVALSKEGAAGGKIKPDLVGLGNSQFLQAAEIGIDELYLPLDLRLDDFFDTYVRAFSYEGRMYAAPLGFAPIVLLYNKTMFDEAGLNYPGDDWTWEELLKAAKALTRYDGLQAERYGFSFAANFNRWPLFVLQNGGSFTRNGSFQFDDPRLREALQFSYELIYKHKVSPIVSIGNQKTGEELFLRQKVGMILTSYIFLEQFRDIDFEWNFVRFPGRVRNAGLGIAAGIAISAECRKVEAAKTFIQYMTSQSSQANFKQNVCYIPARRSVACSRKYPPHPLAERNYYAFEAITEQALTVIDFGLTFSQVEELETELNLLWANVESVDDVMESLKRKWKKPSAYGALPSHD